MKEVVRAPSTAHHSITDVLCDGIWDAFLTFCAVCAAPVFFSLFSLAVHPFFFLYHFVFVFVECMSFDVPFWCCFVYVSLVWMVS